MTMSKDIYREYDIRGIYPNKINEKMVPDMALAFIGLLDKKGGLKISVGRDTRISSPKLAGVLISTLIELGVDVIDLGIVTTPMASFSVSALELDGSIMVTASHNPPEYNGFKFYIKGIREIGGKEIKKALRQAQGKLLRLRSSASSGASSEQAKHKSKTKKRGHCKKFDISKQYIKAISKKFKPAKKKVKVSIDHGKGTAKFFIPELIKKLHITQSKKPDFYASFDYDADRLIIKDKNGRGVRGDIIGGIIADSMAKRKNTIIHDAISSHAIPEFLNNKGVKTIKRQVGPNNIKKMMRDHRSIFAMELSGHYYFKDFEYECSSFFALRKLIEQINKTKQPLEELVKPFSKYYHSNVQNFELDNEEKTKKLFSTLKKKYKNGAQSKIDGLAVEFSNWWFNIRASNTEPLIRLVVEAKRKELLNEKLEEIKSIIRKTN